MNERKKKKMNKGQKSKRNEEKEIKWKNNSWPAMECDCFTVTHCVTEKENVLLGSFVLSHLFSLLSQLWATVRTYYPQKSHTVVVLLSSYYVQLSICSLVIPVHLLLKEHTSKHIQLFSSLTVSRRYIFFSSQSYVSFAQVTCTLHAVYLMSSYSLNVDCVSK